MDTCHAALHRLWPSQVLGILSSGLGSPFHTAAGLAEDRSAITFAGNLSVLPKSIRKKLNEKTLKSSRF
jgi:hypothetical protein